MKTDHLHPIIDNPFQYDIVGFYYYADLKDFLKSYIDLTLQKDEVIRKLRFYGPQDLEIEKGFPWATGGMEILDVSNRQLSNINVWVNDFEASNGSITFWAENVIDLDQLD